MTVGGRRSPLSSPGLKTKRTTPAGVYKKLAGKEHLHACTDLDCLRVYVDNCQSPAINVRCTECRGPHKRPVWEAARDPQPCCLDNCEQVISTDELERYDLGGPGPWFQCRRCARCHPRPPVSTTKGQP